MTFFEISLFAIFVTFWDFFFATLVTFFLRFLFFLKWDSHLTPEAACGVLLVWAELERQGSFLLRGRDRLSPTLSKGAGKFRKFFPFHFPLWWWIRIKSCLPPTLRVSPLARSKVSHQTCTSSSAGTLRYVFLFLWYLPTVITRSSSCTWPCSGSSQGSWVSQWWPGDEAWTHKKVWKLQDM